MIETVAIDCPYCGESIDVLVDASAGDQRYVEDCSVCCRPMVVGVALDAGGDPVVTVASENDA